MSLFKRPAWSQPVAPAASRDADSTSLHDDESGINDRDESKGGARSLFSHSEKFMSIMQDSERQRQRREAREKEKREQRQAEGLDKSKARGKKTTKASDSESGSDCEEERRSSSSKRRRISARDGAALLQSIGMSSPLQSKKAIQSSLDEDDEEEGEKKYKSARMRSSESPRRGKVTVATRSQSAVTLDDSDDEIEYLGAASRSATQKKTQHENDDDEDESDPELLELKRKARARLAQQEKSAPTSGSQPTTSTTTDTSTSSKPPATPPDAPVKILITSPIPNTNPLLIYRKLSQRLQEVREVWCVKQGFSEDFAQSVFLTYRQRRLFNVTTCRSLGLEADEHGNVTRVEDRTKEGVDQVHLEAVTPELFEQIKAERARQARNEADGEEGDTAEQGNEAGSEERGDEAQKQTQTQQNIKIVVKAKGRPEFKLLVKADTQIARIIKAARKNFGISDDQSTRLEFDGDELDPQDQVQNTEIEDMVCLDLHVGS